jgi:hypothetical protein
MRLLLLPVGSEICWAHLGSMRVESLAASWFVYCTHARVVSMGQSLAVLDGIPGTAELIDHIRRGDDFAEAVQSVPIHR